MDDHGISLYNAAMAADAAFQVTLEAKFGKDACNRRYYRDGWTEDILVASAASRLANDTWLEWMQAHL